MKRVWFGAALLLVLLALGIGSSIIMGRLHQPLAEDLRQAADLALSGNWETAEKIVINAEKKWKNAWHFSASFSDHGPMEEIDTLFAQLDVCRKCRDEDVFAEICACLSRQIKAMGDAHELSWWNLL